MKFVTAMLAVVLLAAPVVVLAGPSVVGSMQGWDPADPAYNLSLNGNGVWVLTKTLTAGFYEYKVTETDEWDGNDFPGGNQSFTLGSDGDVTWFVNLGATVGVKEGDEFVFHSPNPPIVAGDMQSELGGADWDPLDTVNTVMSDGNGDDVWEFTFLVPAGNYQGKVVLNNNWDQSTGDNISFTSDGLGETTFTYDMSNNTTTVSSQVVTQQAVAVTFHLCLSGDTVTSGAVCVTGNHDEITQWGNGVPMDLTCPDLSPKLYEVTVTFAAGSAPFVEYKYKKDDCGTWEDGGNHSFTIDDSGPTMDLPYVDGWSGIEPDCPPCTSPVEDTSWGTIKAIYR
jgi:hypothetical protein